MEAETTDDTSTSTRVFVSGLPLTFSSDDLRKHFSEKFDATDAQVLSDRRIGFVGFRDHETAQNAVRYFNRSFIRMSKIAVSLAKPVDVKRDATGQGAPVSQRQLKAQKQNEWHAEKKRKREAQDDGEAQRASKPVRPANAPSVTLDTVPDTQPENGEVDEFEGFESDDAANGESAEQPQPSASDSDWLRGKTSRTLDLQDPDEDLATVGNPSNLDSSASPQPLQDNEPDNDASDAPQEPAEERPIVANGRLFVRNLAFTVSDNELRSCFESHGKLSEVCLAISFTFYSVMIS